MDFIDEMTKFLLGDFSINNNYHLDLDDLELWELCIPEQRQSWLFFRKQIFAKWHPRYIGAHFQGNPFLGKPIVSRIFRNKTYLDRKFIKGTIMPEITTGGKHIESLFLFLLLVGSCCCVGRWQNSFSRSNLTTKNHQKTMVNLDF